MKLFILTVLIISFSLESVNAQMQRTRATEDRPVDELFLIGSVAGMSTVTNLEARNLNSLIMHNFGLVSGGLEDFYGLDQGAAVRIGFDYGLTDRLTLGIGRTSVEDNVDLRFKYTVFRQLESDKMPVEVAVKGDIGVNTQEQPNFDFSFQERLNYFGSVMIARKFNDKFTLQLSPMISHFNTVIQETAGVIPVNTHFALGFGGRLKLDTRNSLTFEYLPVIGKRTQGTVNHFAVGYEIETGGHVFQMFFMSGQWFTEQHLIARNTNDFLEGDFRLGFNINRIFGL